MAGPGDFESFSNIYDSVILQAERMSGQGASVGRCFSS